MGVRSYEARDDARPVRRGPAVGALWLVGGLVLAGLLVNGRPGVGEGTPPFASALGATGAALLGKLAASLGAAVAAGFLFLAVGLRRPQDEARTTAFLLAFGTTLWGAAQSFSATPFSTALVAAALWLLVKAEDDPAMGPRAGLLLGLGVALQPADLALALVLALFAAARRPRQIGLWALWSAPGLALAAVRLATTDVTPSAFRFDADWAPRLAALWVAPAAGLVVFAPVVLVGLTGLLIALRRADLPLAASCMAAFLAHGLVIAARPLAGATWGPRDWTDALPLALLFLPEGLDRLRGAGAVLAVLSVAVQALGAFTYDGRWDRLFAATPEKRTAVIWDAARSPIPFAVSERVVIAALPQVQGGVRIAEHRVVLGGSEGSRVSATASRLAVAGADPTLGHVHLQGGARVEGDVIRLEAPGDAVFFRIRPESRGRRLEIRIAGRGQGSLALEEGTFWSPKPRSRDHSTAGAFRLKVPYFYSESGGGDVRLTLRSGSVAVSSVSLVPPTEPENVIRLQGPPDR